MTFSIDNPEGNATTPVRKYVWENPQENKGQFHTEMISAEFLYGNVLLGEELQIEVNNSNSKIFESALYVRGGMSLRTKFSVGPYISALNWVAYSF